MIFCVVINLSQGAFMNDIPAQPPRPALLLVDDDPDALELLGMILEGRLRDTYRLFSASDSYEAVQIAASLGAELQLIITDQGLPGADGSTLVRNLRKKNPGLQALAITGLSCLSPDDEVLFRRVFIKPIKVDHLVEAINQALEQHAAAA